MKKETIKFFSLRRKRHPVFGMGYVFTVQKRDWVKDAVALSYNLKSLELWAKNMQDVLKKEEHV